ncbi:hypothetical protein [Clostridium sp. UBA4548]|uniref:hypothetical protein n=1 Tax=Clostridium sp. UBA4548 TaxID=1946361 RepID=UPI0025C19061|nr:hypothetical protein [Clostridium sp. UBA4548]
MRKGYSIVILIIVTAIASMGITKLVLNHTEPSFYKIDYLARDIKIEDFQLVSIGKSVYIPMGLKIQYKGNKNVKVNFLIIGLKKGEEYLFSMTTGNFEFTTENREKYLPSNTYLRKIDISKDANLDLMVEYEIGIDVVREHIKINLEDYKNKDILRD